MDLATVLAGIILVLAPALAVLEWRARRQKRRLLREIELEVQALREWTKEAGALLDKIEGTEP